MSVKEKSTVFSNRWRTLLSAAKDLGITRVVVVGFFVSKAHAGSLSLCIFLLFLSFDYFLSPYLSIILLFMSTYLGLPTTTYLPISTYLLTFDIILTYLNLPTPINVPTYNDTHLPMSSYQPMSICHHIPTFLYQFLSINI